MFRPGFWIWRFDDLVVMVVCGGVGLSTHWHWYTGPMRSHKDRTPIWRGWARVNGTCTPSMTAQPFMAFPPHILVLHTHIDPLFQLMYDAIYIYKLYYNIHYICFLNLKYYFSGLFNLTYFFSFIFISTGNVQPIINQTKRWKDTHF